MALPKQIRVRTPDQVRDHPGVRAVALALGLIPPRTMHTPAEADALAGLAAGSGRVIEIGVYEGSSAVRLAAAMPKGSQLHLIDPYTDVSGAAMRPGWHGNALAARIAVRRATRRAAPRIHWHMARSQDVGRSWTGGPVDLVFIDGDHSQQGCREDWDVWHPHVPAGGHIVFHDARHGRPDGAGSIGVTEVVDELFRPNPPDGWRLVGERDSLLILQRV